MNKTLMILGGSILQLPAIQKAKELGLNIVVVDMNPEAIGFKEDVTKEIISTIDIPRVVEAAKKHKIDGVMTLASDMPMRTVAAVAKEMHLVGIDEQTSIRATNKYEMRKSLLKYNVPIPKFYKVTNRYDFLSVIKYFDGDIVIKPVDNSGSRGINKIFSRVAKQELLEAYLSSAKSSRSGDVLVEECMVGPEVSVETITVDGICHVVQITDKLTTGAPHFVEMGHSQPSSLSEETKKQISEVAIAANKAIGIENGPSHTEIIVTKEGPKIVELGARLGGDCITTHLVPLSTGVDLVESCIKVALGEKPNIDSKFKKGSAIRYFHQKSGVIKEISGVDEAKCIPGVIQVSIVHNIGEKVTDIVDSASRIGFVVAQGSDSNEAIRVCEKAMKIIKIRYE